MDGPTPCEIISWEKFRALCRIVAFKILESGFRPDLIIAIARGGLMPARILADYLGLMNLACIRIEHYRGSQRQPMALIRDTLSLDVRGKRVLVVDDVSDSGETFEKAVAHIQERMNPVQIKTAALHHKVVSTFIPDFYANRLAEWHWITYPWAVVEDLTGFIKSMSPQPDTIGGIAERLESEHGIQVERQTISDVLAMMENYSGD